MMLTRPLWLTLLLLCVASFGIVYSVAQQRQILTNVALEGGMRRNIGVLIGEAAFHETLIVRNLNGTSVHVAFLPSKGCACVEMTPLQADIPPRQTLRVRMSVFPDGSGEITKTVPVVTTAGIQTKQTYISIRYPRPKH